VPKKKRLLLVQPTRHQPKTAFSRLPPLHRADLEGPLRVRFGAFARLCRMTAICAIRPKTRVDVQRTLQTAGRRQRLDNDNPASGSVRDNGINPRPAARFVEDANG